jgi:dolichol-phosphate mannosyltransferase
MISLIVPVLNEQDNVTPLLEEISQAAMNVPVSEIIFVDDGSTDDTYALLSALRKKEPRLRILRHERRSGQSAALWTGIKAAHNETIVTLDGDCQNNPADIRNLHKLFEQSGGPGVSLMIAGQRVKRQDNIVRRISSRAANKIRSWLLEDGTRDTGCSLKMFRRSDYLALPFFNHMHRFLPALMMREGVRVLHVDVSHRPRTKGASKYGTLDRLIVSISDIMGVLWLLRRARPQVRIYEDL